VWLDANDLRPELEFSGEVPGKITEEPDPATRHGPEFSRLTPATPQSVRLTSVRVPFREILVLVLKFYLAVLLVGLAGAAFWVLLGYLLR
jgi:hypothetical protein